MNRPDFDDYDVYLSPGDFYFGKDQGRVKTVLGSCIAITMWEPKRQYGGMGHFMLPSRGGSQGKVSSRNLDGKYADELLILFLNAIREADTHPHDYEIKLFGGGNMFPNVVKDTKCINIPSKNIYAARTLIAQYGFQVFAEHLGGDGYRNLIFDLSNGFVYLSFRSSSVDKKTG